MAKQTKEAKVKKRLKEFFIGMGAFWYMPATGGMGKSGGADFLPVIIKGRVWAVEAKGDHNDKTTPLQRLSLQHVFDCGGNVAVVDSENIDDFEERFIEYVKFMPDAPRDLRRDEDRNLPE